MQAGDQRKKHTSLYINTKDIQNGRDLGITKNFTDGMQIDAKGNPMNGDLVSMSASTCPTADDITSSNYADVQDVL